MLDNTNNKLETLKTGQKVAGTASLLFIFLVMLQAAAGFVSGAVVLIADAVHTLTDLLAVFASWLGLKISSKPATKKFPYGFYKAETLAALFISLLIIYMGINLFKEGWNRLFIITQLKLVPLALAVALISAILLFILSAWERKVGKKINSQSLIASSDDARVDVITSLLVFVSIILTHYGIPKVEGILTILLAGLIVWVGLKNGRVAIYGLMDASLDPKLEKQVKQIALQIPGVKGVGTLKIRHSGTFTFGELHLKIAKCVDVNRAHQISHQAEDAVKSKLPQIDSISVHIEPYQPPEITLMLPLKEDQSLDSEISEHFGRAKIFFIAKLKNKNLIKHYTRTNKFKDKEIRAALDVVNFFAREKIDVLITKEIGEIGFHALRNNFIDIYFADENTVKETINKFILKKLKPVTAPTHKSNKEKPGNLKEKIKSSLKKVIDPETGEDVLGMGLIKDLEVSESGDVSLKFRPTLPTCPIGFKLAFNIKGAIKKTAGVKKINLEVIDFNGSDKLNQMLKEG